MSQYFADRVRETSVTSGTGALTLLGARPSFQSFSSAFALGYEFLYAIVDSIGNTWEVGKGNISNSTTLNRDIVLASSNAGALVNFAANPKDVFATIAANPMQTKSNAAARSMGLDMP